jgi:UDP-N-acetylmuramoyl-L-alanyl-D-glutamate--2,6-diaminopimelate ligase
MLSLIKKLIPVQILEAIRPAYHGAVAQTAHWYFGKPSHKLTVIGVTGTNGKSTTVNLIARILEEAGHKTGLVSTVNFKISDQERLNDMKMTTPSGWLLHKWMREMVNSGMTHAVLEISSQGLAQNRCVGIEFDVAVFTNLTPEHIEAHGGFENYKHAKGLLFSSLKKNTSKPTKAIVANLDDENFSYYINFPADQHISFGISDVSANFVAEHIAQSMQGVSFVLKGTPFNLTLKGHFDIYNALAAIAACSTQGVTLEIAKRALEKVKLIPGRMEVIQDKPFSVLVDYAPEPYSLKALYETISVWPKQRLIHILGSTGGGRDKARRKILGEMSAQTADIVIVTNEDPYDDDPQEIINEVAQGAFTAGKIAGENLFAIADRREAIAKAIAMAKPGDLILITGKGSEQKMAVANGKYIDWDDRQVSREELAKLHL